MSGKNNGGGGRARQTARRILYGTLAASLLVHLGLVALVNGWLRVVPAPEPERVELELRQPEPPPQPDSDGEIVDLPPAPESEAQPPEDARFRSDRNSRVEKETAARNRRPAPQAGDGNATPTPAEKPPAAAKPAPPAPPSPEPELAEETPEPPEETREERTEEAREQVALLPNLQTLSRMMSAPSPDRLQDVEEGDRTRLNAFIDPNATFWIRVKRLVAQAWWPLVNDELRVHARDQVARQGERVTLVRVVLDRRGEVVAVRVVRSSGFDYLDDVAVQAFRDVGRIPNPPPALLDARGYLSTPFYFIVEDRGAGVVWGDPRR